MSERHRDHADDRSTPIANRDRQHLGDPPLTAFIGTGDVPMLTDEERALIDAGGRLRYAIVKPEIEGSNSRE